MRKIALIAAAGLIALGACKKDEEEDEPSAYQGEWDFKSEEGSFDTTFTTSIDVEGNFSYTLMVGQYEAKIAGNVDQGGQLDGDIGSSGLTVGRMVGNLKTNGTGNGNYIILNDTLAWEATKQ